MKLNFHTATRAATICLFCILTALTNTALAESSANYEPAAAADALHTAIATGDIERVERILDPKVLIFESGGVESSLEEYASHHMHSDMEFMAGMEREVLGRDVFEANNLAVVTTRSRLTGQFKDRAIDSSSLETLVLHKANGRWKVRHIHWSSRAVK